MVRTYRKDEAETVYTEEVPPENWHFCETRTGKAIYLSEPGECKTTDLLFALRNIDGETVLLLNEDVLKESRIHLKVLSRPEFDKERFL